DQGALDAAAAAVIAAHGSPVGAPAAMDGTAIEGSAAGEPSGAALPPAPAANATAVQVSCVRSGEPWAAKVMSAQASTEQSTGVPPELNVDVTSRLVLKLPSAPSGASAGDSFAPAWTHLKDP